MPMAGGGAVSAEPAVFSVARPPEMPSPNRRWSWQKRARVTREIRTAVAMEAASVRHEQGIEPCGLERRKLTLAVIHAGHQRLLDPDNLVASMKPLVDGLRDAGWLHDDSPDWCDLHVTQHRGERAVIVVSVSDFDSDVGAAAHRPTLSGGGTRLPQTKNDNNGGQRT